MAFRVINDGASSFCLERSCGLDFPHNNWSASWMVYLDSDRAAAFQTYLTVGRPSFASANDYFVAFDGNGAPSNNFAWGSDSGQDVYSAVAPVASRWYRMGCSRRKIAANSYVMMFYPDLDSAPSVADIESSVAVGKTTNDFLANADDVIQWGLTPWTSGEGIDGRMCHMKMWNRALPRAALALESRSWQIQCADFRASIYGQWRCQTATDLRDLSGHGRHLHQVGTVSSIASAPSLVSWREPVGLYLFDAGIVAAASATGFSIDYTLFPKHLIAQRAQGVI